MVRSLVYCLCMLVVLPYSAEAMACIVNTTGFPSLQSAINDPSCNIIEVPAGNFAENISIHRSVTIRGVASNQTMIVGHAQGTVVNISAGKDVNIENVTISRGNSVDGGGIHNEGSLTLDSVIIRQNQASHDGGGIFNTGKLSMTSVVVEDNSAGHLGGGIFADHSLMTEIMKGSDIRGNLGSGIYLLSSTVVIEDSKIRSNSNGIYLSDVAQGSEPGRLNMRNSVVDSNNVSSGIFIGTGNTANIESSTISNNSNIACSNGGGGVFSLGDEVSISRSEITGNEASRSGGGILNSGRMTIEDSLISENIADPTVHGTSPCTSSSIINMGGGVANSSGSLEISRSAIIGNISREFGGGIVQTYRDGFLRITNSTISGNNATKKGGGIAVLSATPIDVLSNKVEIKHVTIVDNTAKHAGGIFIRRYRKQWPFFHVMKTAIASNLPENCVGIIVSDGFNFDNDFTCQLNLANDIHAPDPMLSQLTDGRYHFPMGCSSPLVNHAGSATQIVDQRRAPRPKACGDQMLSDIGAIERQARPLVKGGFPRGAGPQ